MAAGKSTRSTSARNGLKNHMELYEAQAIGFGLIFTLLGIVCFLYIIVTTLTTLIFVSLGITVFFFGMTFLRNRAVPQPSDRSFYRLK